MALSSRQWNPLVVEAVGWLLLYAGVTVALFATFAIIDAPVIDAPIGLALSLGAVITAVAFVAVVVDRLLFRRSPDHPLTRQSPWVLVFVALAVAGTGIFLVIGPTSPGGAVLFAVTFALPLTMVLFAAVNLSRYRSMENPE